MGLNAFRGRYLHVMRDSESSGVEGRGASKAVKEASKVV